MNDLALPFARAKEANWEGSSYRARGTITIEWNNTQIQIPSLVHLTYNELKLTKRN